MMSADGYIALKQRLIGAGGPFELVNADCEGAPQPRFRRGPHTLNEIFQRSSNFGSRPFLFTQGSQYSFSDIFRRAEATAANLAHLGVNRGSRLTLELSDPSEWAAAFIAAGKIGASAVLVDPTWDDPKRDEWALSLGCVLRLRSLEDAKVLGNSAHLAGAAPIDTDEALVTFTSGSTGRPKAVSIDHRGLVTGLRSMMLLAVLNPSSVGDVRSAGPPCALTFSPMHYIGGYSALIFSMMSGTPLVVSTGAAKAAFGLIEAHEVRSIGGVTRSHLLDLLDAPPALRAKLESLRTLNYFGAELESQLIEQFERAYPGLGLSAGYGLTETNGAIASGTLAQFRQRPGVAGRLSPTAEVRVVDDWGFPLSRGSVGNLEVSGAFLAKSYVGSPDATAIRGSWFATGDQGYLDEQDFLYVHGRRHFLEIEGRQIDIVTLERKIASLFNVRDVVIISDYDRSIVTVVTSPNTADIPNIARLVGDAIGNSRWGISFTAFENFPLTASGKISRVEVAKHIKKMPRSLEVFPER